MTGPLPRALGELVRWPAALSVPGDSLAGATASGWPFGTRTPALALSSACLYWAGMALNDYADRDVDATERPGRPIPSGRVPARAALGIASGLTAAGLGAAALAGGRRTVAVAAPLAATVWAYDLALKKTPAGPATMAVARSLDVLLGAGAGHLRAAAPAATTMGMHTLAVTTLSRSEVTGSRVSLPVAGLASTATVTAATVQLALRARMATAPSRGAAQLPRLGSALRTGAFVTPLTTYVLSVGQAQLDAARQPNADRLQCAVAAGIHGMMPLQSALIAGALAPLRSGGDFGSDHYQNLHQYEAVRYGAAAAVLAAFPLARKLSRRVSPT